VAAGEPAWRHDEGGLVERYEELRRRVFGGEPDGFRLGLAVLQRQGMVAWLRAWEELGSVTSSPAPAPGASPVGILSDVVAVLATMTLASAGVGAP
jgi:hypothetical protein